MTLDLAHHTWLGHPLTALGLSVVPLFPRRSEPVLALAPGAPLHAAEQATPGIEALAAHNPGAAPLLVPAGALLKGGMQDRVVVRPWLLPPDGRARLHTRCVEQNRWGRRPQDADFSVEREPLAVQGARQRVGDGQDAIWQAVAEHRSGAGRPRQGSLAEGRDLLRLRRQAAALGLPASACGVMVFWDHPGAPALPMVEACASAAAFRDAWPHLALTLVEAHEQRLAARGRTLDQARAPAVDLRRALQALRVACRLPVVARHPAGLDAQAHRLHRRGSRSTTGGWAVTQGQRLLHLRLDRARHAA